MLDLRKEFVFTLNPAYQKPQVMLYISIKQSVKQD